MIDVLNKVVESRQQTVEGERDFEPIPEGNYSVKVLEIGEWKPLTKDVWVNKRDGNGRVLKDAKGKIEKELHKNLTFYNCDVVLEIQGGDYDGRRIWTSLTTHPNAEFITQGFLYAVREHKMTYGEIPANCVDKLLEVEVFVEDVEKEITDADTGLTETVTKSYTRVKRFIRPSLFTSTSEDFEV